MDSPRIDGDSGRGLALGEVSNGSYRDPYSERGSAKAKASSPESLRRVNSLRTLPERIYSSDESLPSSTDSIYNAIAVLSKEDLLQIPTRQDENWPLVSQSPEEGPQDSHAGTGNLPLIPSYPSLHTSSSHSKWPAAPLDTILEQNSHKSIRLSTSHTRLRSSPERRSNIVKPKDSIHSVHPARIEATAKGDGIFKRAAINHTIRNGTKHARSWSCNDLDCLQDQPSRWVGVFHSPSSDSSIAFLQRICPCPAGPRNPVEQAPVRAPTPPGLASFGTPEAQQYRLASENFQNRRMSRWRRWWFGSEEESDHPFSSGSGPSDPGTSSPESNNPPMDLVKRMLGMSRPISTIPTRDDTSQRVPLPPGIISVNELGFLARAEDGTYVRGRFGNRASAHGVGHRGIESHPLHRAPSLNPIDEACLEIDKACAAVDMANQRIARGQPSPDRIHSSFRAVSPHSELNTNSGLGGSEVVRNNRVSELARIRFSPVRQPYGSNASSPSRVAQPWRPTSEATVVSTERPQSIRSGGTTVRMQEPAPYASGALRNHDTLGAFQQCVAPPEQLRDQETVMNEKTKSRNNWKVCGDELRRCFCPLSTLA